MQAALWIPVVGAASNWDYSDNNGWPSMDGSLSYGLLAGVATNQTKKRYIKVLDDSATDSQIDCML